MKLYLIRHARQDSTLCNVNVKLSEIGVRQAKHLAKRLQDAPIDAIYSSDLIRAVETANYINEFHNLPHEIRKDLKEIDFGDLTGHDDEYIKATYPDYFAQVAKMEEDIAYPGGESGEQVYLRSMRVLNEIIKSGKKEVVVVTHGGVIRALCAGILGLGQGKRPLFATSLENTGITVFDYNEEKRQFYLQRFNDCAHLESDPELLRHTWKK